MSEFKPAPVKTVVSLSALEALDIRLGEIVAVDNVPNSSKLVRLEVSFGDHTRTSRNAWRGKFPRECCSISASPITSGRRYSCRNGQCRMGQEQDRR